MKIIVRRTAGIGDSLAATVVADLLHEQGHEVVWQCHPEIIPIIKRHPTIVRVEPPKGHCDVNLDGAYENMVTPNNLHFQDLFVLVAIRELRRIGVSIPFNSPHKPPSLEMSLGNRMAMDRAIGYEKYKRIMVVPRSLFLTRCVSDSVWNTMGHHVKGTLFWLGQHPPPIPFIKPCGLTLDVVADYIALADLVVTVDTGPMHIASAYGIPMVVISQSHDVHLRLSPLSDFEVVKRKDLDCLNCQRHRCPIDPYNPPCGQIDPKELADVVNRKLAKLESPNPIAA